MLMKKQCPYTERQRPAGHRAGCPFAGLAAPLTASLATHWILDGSAYGLMEGVRKEARLRHRMARGILAGRYEGAGDGLHAWPALPGPSPSAAAVVAAAP